MYCKLLLRRLAICCSFCGAVLATLSCSEQREQDTVAVHGGDLPSEFASLSDSSKVSALLDRGVSIDSLASFVVECADDAHPELSFTNYEDVEAIVEERLGEESAGIYSVAFEANLQRLPLDKKYLILSRMPMTEFSLLGYKLGLEYVDRVLDQGFNIGRVDLEVAEFHRACGSNEGLYEDFLDGFATGLRESVSRNIPAAVLNKYGR